MAGARTLLAVLVLLVAVALPASAMALAPTFNVKVAKHKDGPYKVDIKANIDAGDTQTFWFRVRNTGDAENLELEFGDADTSDQDGFKTRWFKHGTNISDQVEGGGYDFRVDPGQSKYFNAKQRAPAPSAPSCLAGQVTLPTITSDLSSVSINNETCAF